MNNLVNMNTWDPNSTMGDMQLMALASWMTNEDTRAKEIWRVMEEEIENPYISDHNFSAQEESSLTVERLKGTLH